MQREYFAPSFAETSFRKDLRRQLQNESLLALRELDREKFESELRVAIERREPAGIFDLLRVLHDTEADRAIVVEAARPQLGDRIDQLLHAISELKRRSSIAGYRAQVRNPEHRFFLAILANAPNREYFLNLVAGAYPESRPVDTVLRWIDELAEQPLENEPTNNAFGLPIDGGYTDILKLVMEDFSLADVLKRLEKEFSNVESQREAVTEMYELVRHESIFSVLFPR